MKTRLILLKGHPGSGKTALGHALAQRVGFPLLSKDDFKRGLLAEGHPEANRLAYQLLWQAADHELEFGVGTIVDSPLSYVDEFECAQDLAVAHGTSILVIECQPSPDVWRARLDQRRSEPRDHRIRSWEQMQELLGRYDGCYLYPIPPEYHLRLDTGATLEATVDQVLDRLRA